jgi:galactokinase
MHLIINKIKQKFEQTFQEKPLIIRAPGRVNLIGEHTDYNDGFVLPAAINKAIYIGLSKRQDDQIHLVSIDLDESFTGRVQVLEQNDQHWTLYILGVVQQLQKAGLKVGGFNLVFSGDIPLGAGLSSSAALECGVAFGLNELFALGLERVQMVKMAQAAENEFVGVKCGIMDQFASMMGKKNFVIQLDCRSLDYTYNPIEMEGIDIVLFDSCVSHSLASSEYNTRRLQCEQGVKLIRQKYPQVKTLRDATQDMLDELVKDQDPVVYRRCRYVVQENRRLLEGCEDLKRGDVAAFGQKMYETHTGLSKNYEVSCPELDFLIDCVKDQPGVLGARMMGGGFGGCTINLVKKEAIQDLISAVSAKYEAHTGKKPKVYVAQTEAGVGIVHETEGAVVHS